MVRTNLIEKERLIDSVRSLGFGVVILIHDNSQLPLIEAAGIEIASGFRHKLAYRKKTSYFLSSPYTKCTNRISFSMQAMFDNCNHADYSYSETLCYQLCGQVYACECFRLFIDPIGKSIFSFLDTNGVVVSVLIYGMRAHFTFLA